MTATLRSPRIRILLWTRRSKTTVLEKLEPLLPEGYKDHIKGIESILDELSKNAIKANHKHLIIRKRIAAFMEKNPGAVEHELDDICMDMSLYNDFVREHPDVLDGITEELSALLRQESVWIDFKNKNKPREEMTEKEKELLDSTRDFKSIYSEVKGRRVYVEIRASRSGNSVWIEIINTAPILKRDLDRILEKRDAFRAHREAGTEYEFFLNAMDHSDGGSGLGYATIDTHLSDMGLEPMTALTVLSLHNTTVMLNFDLSKMKKTD